MSRVAYFLSAVRHSDTDICPGEGTPASAARWPAMQHSRGEADFLMLGYIGKHGLVDCVNRCLALIVVINLRKVRNTSAQLSPSDIFTNDLIFKVQSHKHLGVGTISPASTS